MTPKEQYYRYGESLGIKINDLQRLKMLADNCQEDNYHKGYLQGREDMAFKILEDLEMHVVINEHDWNRNPQAQLRDFIESLNKKD